MFAREYTTFIFGMVAPRVNCLVGIVILGLGLVSCETETESPERSPIETLNAFYDAVNKADSIKAAQLGTAERKATMYLAWPLLMQDIKLGFQYRLESPEVAEYSPDSLACSIYYDRIEYKGDSTKAIRRDYHVTAYKEEGQWLLHSGSDNPFPDMLDEHPGALDLIKP